MRFRKECARHMYIGFEYFVLKPDKQNEVKRDAIQKRMRNADVYMVRYLVFNPYKQKWK
jgi:hypothetical protein